MFDFARSRQEAPEKYESYVDLEPGVWTEIQDRGRTAAARDSSCTVRSNPA